MTIAEKSFLKDENGLQIILDEFTKDMNFWTAGKMCWSANRGGVAALVIGIPTILLGDSIGRAEAGGNKVPTPTTNRGCTHCLITAKERVECSRVISFKANPRGQETFATALLLKNDSISAAALEEGLKWGIREWSPLRGLAGMNTEADYTRFISLDFMHLVVEGVGERIFRNVIRFMTKYVPNSEQPVWNHLSQIVNDYQVFNRGNSIGKLNNEAAFK